MFIYFPLEYNWGAKMPWIGETNAYTYKKTFNPKEYKMHWQPFQVEYNGIDQRDSVQSPIVHILSRIRLNGSHICVSQLLYFAIDFHAWTHSQWPGQTFEAIKGCMALSARR